MLDMNIDSKKVNVGELKGVNETFYRDYYFGVDEEYAYFYLGCIIQKCQIISSNSLKSPSNNLRP